MPLHHALHAFSFLPVFFFKHIPYRSRRKTMSHTLIVGFSLSPFLSATRLIFSTCLRCVILVIYWSSIHRPSLRATSWNGTMRERHWPFYTSLITFCCCCVYCGALSPFDSLCFDRLGTCLVPDSFLQCKPFLEESPKRYAAPTLEWAIT